MTNPKSKQQLREQLQECFDNFGHDVVNFGDQENARATMSQKYVDYLMQAFENFHTAEVERARYFALLGAYDIVQNVFTGSEDFRIQPGVDLKLSIGQTKQLRDGISDLKQNIHDQFEHLHSTESDKS